MNLGAGQLCVLGADSPEKQYEGCRLLDALQHALFGQVIGAVVVPCLEAHALELEVDGVGLQSSKSKRRNSLDDLAEKKDGGSVTCLIASSGLRVG